MTGETAPTTEQIRDWLKEHVTVVAPGETLVIRAWEWMTAMQCYEVHRALNVGWDEGDPVWPFRVLVVPGAGLGKVSASELEDAVRPVVRDEMEAVMTRADAAAVADDDLDDQ